MKPAVGVRRIWRSARRHFSLSRSVPGRPVRAPRSGTAIHASGMHGSHPNGLVTPSAMRTVDTASWQLPILPSTSLLDPEPDFREFQQHLEFALMRDEVVRGQDVGHHRAGFRKREASDAMALAFALQRRVRHGRQGYVTIPAGIGSPDEVVQAEFGLQLGVLLFDRPALVRQAHQRGERGGNRQMDQVLLRFRRRAEIALTEQARAAGLLSDEHFSVDGTWLEAAAGVKSFHRTDRSGPPPDDPGNPTVDFHGERRSNTTHRSTTDPDSRLLREGGQGATLRYLGGVLMDNRHGLVVQATAVIGSGTAERDVALAQLAPLPPGRKTVGADKGYDHRACVDGTRATGQPIDGRTTRHAGYRQSQRRRKRVEEIFGWMKTVGLLRRLRHRGVARVGWVFVFTAAAYNLVRMRTLAAQPA